MRIIRVPVSSAVITGSSYGVAAGAAVSPDLSGQPHCELVASVKLLTELTTLAASLATCAAEGLDARAATELLRAFTDEVMALVWLGKSPLADG